MTSITNRISSNASTSSLKDELEEITLGFIEANPQEIMDILIDKAEKLAASGIMARAVKTGDIAPHFRLPDTDGEMVSIQDLCMDGPVILTFYRGEWCPYCNITLRALQTYLPKFEAKGAKLIAISPQLPDYTAKTAKKTGATFSVLSDVGCKVGREYGLDFVLDEEVRQIYEQMGADIPLNNGDNSFKLPIPATYVVDTDGTVLYSWLDTDYTKRAEPEEILESIPDYGPRNPVQ